MYRKVSDLKENAMYLEVFNNAWTFNDTEYDNNKTDRYIMFTDEGEVFGAFAFTLYNMETGSTIENLYKYKENVKEINTLGYVTIEITAFAIKQEFQSPTYFKQSFFYMTQELINLNTDYCIGLTERKFSRLLQGVFGRNLTVLEKNILAEEDNTKWYAMILDMKAVCLNINQYPILKYGAFNIVQNT
ncbi:hypothetical protein [Priestia aryabhattai]